MERLKQVVFFVEANSNEQQILWEQNNKKAQWKQDMSGFSMTIGHIKSGKEKLPVVISFSFADINDKKVCFYHACSRGVDHEIVDNFIRKNYPIYYDNGSRFAKTDAQNFHHCLNFLIDS